MVVGEVVADGVVVVVEVPVEVVGVGVIVVVVVTGLLLLLLVNALSSAANLVGLMRPSAGSSTSSTSGW